MRPFRADLAKYADDAFKEFPTTDKVAVLPSEVSESRALNIAENVATGSVFGGRRMTTVQATRQTQATEKAAAQLERLGPKVPEAQAASQAGKTATRSINDAVVAFRGQEAPAWRAAITEILAQPAETDRDAVAWARSRYDWRRALEI